MVMDVTRALAALLLYAAVLPFPAAGQCPGCDGDERVTISELVTGVAIALGNAEPATCAGMDRNRDGALSIDELVAAIAAALNGCTAAASPTPTGTPAAASPTPTAVGGVPTEPGPLLAWLERGEYLAWMRESAPHPSSGPHGGIVRTYLNDPLFDSLAAASAQHPAGAAAVKELYFGGSSVGGWAVMVKIAADSAGGDGWYWYEYFGSGAPYSGVGLDLCTGCHAEGADYVRIPFPLQ